MFNKILIANRGEIAVRIIRACQDMGIRTVAVFSSADRDSLHAQLADEAVCIGPAAARDSYLNMPAILSATVLTGAEAIHPGFGFLSENSRFASMCKECSITFIGPPASAMEAMGHKLRARLTMIDCDVPVIPGSKRLIETEADAVADAEVAGYPLLVKAAAGGGGRGIRRVDKPEDLSDAIASARAEALAGFGDDGVYIERLIEAAKHIEFQILCDEHGNAVHLFERDCSMQRRRQKVVEEGPSSLLTPKLRKAMGDAAVRAAKACGYVGAGTVEFLVDDSQNYYFMEMNARIQVEHPVTEAITGVDLIRQQILVADGQPLSFGQRDLAISGHAIECRVNAEDPSRGFSPSCGSLRLIHMPGGPGVRVDSLLYDGVVISPHYDSMLAKLIVHAPTRAEAIVRMKRALNEIVIDGITTNIDFLYDILSLPAFEQGNYNTSTLEQSSLG